VFFFHRTDTLKFFSGKGKKKIQKSSTRQVVGVSKIAKSCLPYSPAGTGFGFDWTKRKSPDHLSMIGAFASFVFSFAY